MKSRTFLLLIFALFAVNATACPYSKGEHKGDGEGGHKGEETTRTVNLNWLGQP